MKKLIVMALIGMAMTVAEAGMKEQKAQNIGIGSGAVIGAVAGGPLGAFIGAAIGGHYADTLHRSGRVPGLERDLQTAETERDESKNEVARLNRSLFETRSDLDRLSAEASDLLLERAAFEGLQMEVMYQTGDSVLTGSAAARLAGLGELLQKLPDMTVRLDGYADPRGDEDFNDELSRERAESVRDALIDAGIEMDRIAVYAHGESGAVADSNNPDAFALDRKVRVRLSGPVDGARVALEN